MKCSNYFVKYLCFEYIFSDTTCLDTLWTVKIVQSMKGKDDKIINFHYVKWLQQPYPKISLLRMYLSDTIHLDTLRTVKAVRFFCQNQIDEKNVHNSIL